MIASFTAFGSSSSCTARCQARSFASAVGTSARARSACRCPVDVGSRSCSAAMSASGSPPVDPCATSACSSRQRQVRVDGQPVRHVRRRTASRGTARAADSGSTLPASELTDGELRVRARLRGVEPGPQRVDQHRPAPLGGPLLVGVGHDRGLGLQQQPLQHPDLGLGGRARPPRARTKSRALQLGLAGHLPRRPTSTGCGAAARRCRRCRSISVASEPGSSRSAAVGEVVVVDQHERRRGRRRPARGPRCARPRRPPRRGACAPACRTRRRS